MQTYISSLLQALGIQIAGVFGMFFVCGFILSLLQRLTHKNYHRAIGWKGILWTAWIGTPIHELSHVFFAKLFRHRVDHISLFSPNEVTGGLGHVEHSYNPRSLYQRIGNFFIGAAPLIGGSVILITLLYFLVPNGKEVFLPLTESQTNIQTFVHSLSATITHLFSLENLRSWVFWAFLYISFCIASHIAPSPQDRKGMWSGFVWIVLILLLINGITLALQVNITSYILLTTQYLAIFIAMFVYAIVLSLIHFLLSSLVFIPFHK